MLTLQYRKIIVDLHSFDMQGFIYRHQGIKSDLPHLSIYEPMQHMLVYKMAKC